MNENEIVEYFQEVKRMLDEVSISQLKQVLEVLEETYIGRHHIFIIGNGGSAATASHFACDLAKNTVAGNAIRVKAIALTDNIPLMTAWANDVTYEDIFAEQLLGLLEAGDAVIGISTSGKSPNIIKALSIAKQAGARTIGILGGDGGNAKMVADASILTTGKSLEQEEDVHLILTHVITRYMRTIVHMHSQELS